MRIIKKFTVTIFVLYLLCLINFVTIKFFGSFQAVQKRIDDVLLQRELYDIWNISLVPFQSIKASIYSFIRDPSFGVVTLFLIGNILIFVPLGFLLPLLLKKPSYIRTILVSLIIIVSIETIQFVTCLGIADVDDVLLNMLGSSIGYVTFVITENLFAIRQKVYSSNSF
ncbi:VanZ family protein [Paenibacillus taichungensis]|uniref:VanZ family protein n=1 Tax=Paenibacillus taichungensis TaxID=484184 RepID=A0A329QDI6_9BACL|nr:VanZ family protein [Paenibacillus tundrae]RAW09739.1 VanZ family protein [Paenibacillus taichungensis]